MVKNVNCNKKLTFEEKELLLLRNAVDVAEKKTGQKIKESNNIDAIIKILEKFLRRKKVVCYGGTAINNILPLNDQFYNKDIEIPDYDFYSSKALALSKELADIYAREGYSDVEVRAGVHIGTYKVYVNFIPIADITQMDSTIFNVLYEQSIRKDGISYSPPDYLRLQMYNELSRPDGDVSRWEKVYKRLILLNKHYPFITNAKCSEINFIRDFTKNNEINDALHNLVKDVMINEGCVFIGGYAASLYGRYMPSNEKKQLDYIPEFDVLSIDPKAVAYILKEKLQGNGFKYIEVIKKPSVGDDIILTHYEVVVNGDTICYIYEPYGCYSYNEITLNHTKLRVATIETMLLFILAFIFSGRSYYDHERLMCMAQYLINVQDKNRLEQKGLLKRFNINCYGYEKTLVEIRSIKAEKYEELKNKKDTPEYNKYFLKYIPTIKGKEVNKPNKPYKPNKTYKPYKPNNKTKKIKLYNKKNKNLKKYNTNNDDDAENDDDDAEYENVKEDDDDNDKKNKRNKKDIPSKNIIKNIFKGIF